ncbi:prephenate dehydratase [Achromobacter insolitus]|uniref:prephenate dehydratase n=1 Tax=Achromobacter insolitus TaxID=217204 RepID=UPI003B9AA5C5
MDDDLQRKLLPLRQRIDALDAQILDLLTQRASAALEVGEVKHAANADGPVLRPEREADVIRRLQQTNPGPFPNAGVAAVWTEIISACRGLERGMTVAFLGPQGSFSEQADVGMVPVENSTEGAVNRSLDLLLNTPLKILGERSLVIRHCLMSQSGSMDGIKTISAHPQALAQCQGWLTRNYPDVARVAASSNSEAARAAAADPSIAAIAGEVAAPAWNLQIVAAGIQDDPHNRTRFLAIGNIEPLVSGKDKTSLILAVPNRAGAVYEMLAPLAANGVSMTRFESRPARTGQWEYYFYVDVLGHRNDPNVERALAALQAQVAYLKVLGSYPAP